MFEYHYITEINKEDYYKEALINKSHREVQRTVGLALIRYILDKHLKDKPLNIKRSTEGYLYCEGRQDIFLSLSHSGKYIAASVANFAIGCDIEKIKERKIEGMKFFFSEEDYRMTVKNEDPVLYFYKLWTRKESFIKLHRCSVDTSHLSFHNKEFFSDHYKLGFDTFYPQKDLIFTVAKKGNDPITKAVILNINKLF